jgi:hypothetical protein
VSAALPSAPCCPVMGGALANTLAVKGAPYYKPARPAEAFGGLSCGLSPLPRGRHPCGAPGPRLRSHVTGRSVRVGEVPETVAGQHAGRAATLPDARRLHKTVALPLLDHIRRRSRRLVHRHSCLSWLRLR